MHTYNLLTAHADRSTIAPDGLMLLDAFLDRQRNYQDELKQAIAADDSLTAAEKSGQTILEHFRLLQACDNLSLLTCVAYASPAHLLHPLPLVDGTTAEVAVAPIAPRRFRLTPWPFAEAELAFHFPARHVAGQNLCLIVRVGSGIPRGARGKPHRNADRIARRGLSNHCVANAAIVTPETVCAPAESAWRWLRSRCKPAR